MTRVNFPPQFAHDSGDHYFRFAPLDNSENALSSMANLSTVTAVEFAAIDQPDHSQHYTAAADAAKRTRALMRSKKAGYAATYLVSSDEIRTEPFGVVSFMYPGASVRQPIKKLQQRLMPRTNGTRDFAGWLRADLIPNANPSKLAAEVLWASVLLASDAGIDTLHANTSDNLNPVTERLIAVEGFAKTIRGFEVIGSDTQHTEGREYPGTLHEYDLSALRKREAN